MKVTLVNYERDFNDGILTKFASKMYDELVKLGVEVEIDNKPNPNSDINHHINYLPYQNVGGKNTLMITHLLDNKDKIKRLKNYMITADIGICMSKEMEEELKTYLPKEKLTHILPAHDGLQRRLKVIAITTRVYPDGCKREWMFKELCKVIDKDKFAFRIMGRGWKDVIQEVGEAGFTNIEYFEEFDPTIYKHILDSSDYYLYFGLDEGSMGTLDAIQCGLKVITTPQGFHKQLPIDYPFTTQVQLNRIFKKLEENPVEDMTWNKYALEHYKIWKKLTNCTK